MARVNALHVVDVPSAPQGLCVRPYACLYVHLPIRWNATVCIPRTGQHTDASVLTDAAAVLTAARTRLDAATTTLTTLGAALPVVNHAPLATPALHNALGNVTAIVLELHHSLANHASASLPGWRAVVNALDAACRDLQPWSTPARGARMVPATDAAAAVAQCVEQVQLWVQGMHGLRMTEQEGGDDQMPPVLRAVHSSARRVHAARVAAVTSSALQALRDGAHGRALHGVLSMLAVACHVACLEQVVVYKALAKLGYVVSSVLVRVLQEGFCMPEGDDGADGALVDECLLLLACPFLFERMLVLCSCKAVVSTSSMAYVLW